MILFETELPFSPTYTYARPTQAVDQELKLILSLVPLLVILLRAYLTRPSLSLPWLHL